MADIRNPRLVHGEPSNGTYSNRCENEPVAEAVCMRSKLLRKQAGDGDGREIVVAERGVADMRVDEDFVLRLALQQRLAIGKDARLQIGIYLHLEGPVAQRIALAL